MSVYVKVVICSNLPFTHRVRDSWLKMALIEKEEAKKVIEALPKEHPFEVKYTQVEKVDWESCTNVLSADEKIRVLSEGWNKIRGGY
jgi:uncharacterized protein (DUF2344 family)